MKNTGVLAGRCFMLPNIGDTYCNVVFIVPNEGSIAAQGYFGGGKNMVIVGGSGCFKDVRGTVQAQETETGFAYNWSVTIYQ